MQSKSSMYFGVYFTGSTMMETGDWAVYDESNNINSISYEDIMAVLQKENYLGYLWVSLDGAATGKWVEQISQ